MIFLALLFTLFSILLIAFYVMMWKALRDD